MGLFDYQYPTIWWGNVSLRGEREGITLHYRHFKCNLHLKRPAVHQQLNIIRNTANRPSTQARYQQVGYAQKGKLIWFEIKTETTFLLEIKWFGYRVFGLGGRFWIVYIGRLTFLEGSNLKMPLQSQIFPLKPFKRRRYLVAYMQRVHFSNDNW